MPNRWLDSQTQAIQHWLRESKCSMLVSTADGGVLWVNQATEELFGYSAAEFLGLGGLPPISWKAITVDHNDLTADVAMVEQMERGERTEYTQEKSYRAKEGKPIPSRIHVLRWPPGGKVDCYLVTIIPLHSENDFMRQELVAMKEALASIAQAQQDRTGTGDLLRDLGKWAAGNPKYAACVVVFLWVLISGEHALDIIERAAKVFGYGGDKP